MVIPKVFTRSPAKILPFMRETRSGELVLTDSNHHDSWDVEETTKFPVVSEKELLSARIGDGVPGGSLITQISPQSVLRTAEDSRA